MTTVFITNELCGNPVPTVPTIPVVGLPADLNEERVTNFPVLESVNENLKAALSGPVLLHTLSQSDSNVQTINNDSLGNITFPLPPGVNISVSYICRLCATLIDFDSVVSIFPNDEIGGNLLAKINKYLPIEVSESDPFPKTVCKTCAGKLNEFHELLEKSVLVEQQLRQSYICDGRYLDGLFNQHQPNELISNNINQKSDVAILQDSESTSQLYTLQDSQHTENFEEVHQKSDLGVLQQDSERAPQLYTLQGSQYTENLEDNNLNPNICDDNDDELNQHEDNLNEVNFETAQSKEAGSQTDCEEDELIEQEDNLNEVNFEIIKSKEAGSQTDCEEDELNEQEDNLNVVNFETVQSKEAGSQTDCEEDELNQQEDNLNVVNFETVQSKEAGSQTDCEDELNEQEGNQNEVNFEIITSKEAGSQTDCEDELNEQEDNLNVVNFETVQSKEAGSQTDCEDELNQHEDNLNEVNFEIIKTKEAGSQTDCEEDELNQQEDNVNEVNFEISKYKEVASQTEGEEEDEDIFECEFCGADLKDLDDCMQHSLSHADSDSNNHFPCSLCSLSFESKTVWESHIKSHFGTKSQEVEKTPTVPKLSRSARRKLARQKLKKLHKIICCRKCKEKLGSVDTAVKHCLGHKPPKSKTYPCVLCLQRMQKSELEDHVSSHYTLLLTCHNCNNLYPDEKALKYHRCTKVRKYKCSQCNLGFKSEDRLKFHEDFHKTKSTFCDICKRDFKFESKIYIHFSEFHNRIRHESYCCDVCGKTFPWFTVLQKHKRTHTDEKPYKCSRCNEGFRCKFSLRTHMADHDDRLKFRCDKCEYYTTRKHYLVVHVNRFHKEFKPSQTCVQCKICNEIFPNKHHMEVEEHFWKHSPDDPEDSSVASFMNVDSEEVADPDMVQELVATKLYQCERCERCYISSEHLTQHRAKHADDDSSSVYYCRLCNSKFTKHDLLVRHKRVHVDISSQYTGTLSVLTVISCDICALECLDYRQLLSHKDKGNCMQKKISGTLKPKKELVQKHLKALKPSQVLIHSNGLLECRTCHKFYKCRKTYRLHVRAHGNTSS